MENINNLNTYETTILNMLMSNANSIVTYSQLQTIVNLDESELETLIETLNTKLDMDIEPMPFMGFMLKTL